MRYLWNSFRWHFHNNRKQNILMSKESSVSVIIPCYNSASSIKRAVDSVLLQNLISFEVIIIDDGSTDNTLEVVYSLACPNLTVIKLGHAGVSVARNAGISTARGRFIAFLDSDDEWLQGKIALQIKILEEYPEIALVATNAEYINAAGKVVAQRKQTATGYILRRLTHGNNIVTSSVLTRRRILADLVPAFRPGMKVGEDWLLWMRIAARYSCRIVGKPLVRFYWLNPDKYSETDFRLGWEHIAAGIAEDQVLSRHINWILPIIWSNFHYSLASRCFEERNYELFWKEIEAAWKYCPGNIRGFLHFFRIISGNLLSNRS